MRVSLLILPELYKMPGLEPTCVASRLQIKSIADIIRNRDGEACVKKNKKVWIVRFQIAEMSLRSKIFFGL